MSKIQHNYKIHQNKDSDETDENDANEEMINLLMKCKLTCFFLNLNAF